MNLNKCIHLCVPLCNWMASPNPQSLATTDLPVVTIDIFGVTIFETQLKLNFCIPSDLAIWLLGIYSSETFTHVHRKQAYKLASRLLATPILAVPCSCCLSMLPLFDSLFPFPPFSPFPRNFVLACFPCCLPYFLIASEFLCHWLFFSSLLCSECSFYFVLAIIMVLEFSRLFLSSPTLQQLFLQQIQFEKREKNKQKSPQISRLSGCCRWQKADVKASGGLGIAIPHLPSGQAFRNLSCLE